MGSAWSELIDGAVAFRRNLHRRPELPWQETHTAGAIRSALADVGIGWRACAGTGTVATLAARAGGRHVALRADIDALPIAEANSVAWASEIEGRMHACGHDGHTASLMAAAAWLKRHEADLPGPVTLLFQPAEEGGHGARQMVADGALEGVDVIFGWHNWPAIPFGQAVCPDGAVMCANGTFSIELEGEGGHASQPEACRDPVLAAAAVAMGLQQIVSRRMPPQHPAVVSVTSIDARSGPTVIPGRAQLGGSVRVGHTSDRARIFAMIEGIAESIAAGYGVRATVDVQERYAATVNDAEAAAEMRAALGSVLGESWQAQALPVPIMASEDFSYYLQRVPGAFALIGADDGRGHDAPCHSPHYDFNDRLIPHVARLFARLAGAPLPD